MVIREDEVRSLEEMGRSESQIFVGEADLTESEMFFDAETEEGVELAQVASPEVPKLPRVSGALESLQSMDRSCPLWMECISGRSHEKRYAIVVGSKVVFRTVRECEDLVQRSHAKEVIDVVYSPRMSNSERLRRLVGYIMSQPEGCAAEPKARQVFVNPNADCERKFLKHSEPTLSERARASILFGAFTARALSDRHWVEEWAGISTVGIVFYHAERKKPTSSLHLESVLSVSALPDEKCPHFPGYQFVMIALLGRTVYLMFRSKLEQQAFVDTLSRVKASAGNLGPSSVSSVDTAGSLRPCEVENPSDEFLHRSSMWNCKNRRVLNSACFSFVAGRAMVDPLASIETAVRAGLNLSANDASEDSERLRAFLVSASVLKRAHLVDLSHNARLAFFLNLYHLMTLHAFLVLGPPESSFQWISYFNSIAYEVDDDIFSLAELEHCIIRAQMTYPSQFVSRFVLPKSKYQMALTKGNFRINFALNCGSLSAPAKIFIYKTESIDSQLDDASRLYLEPVSCVKRSQGDVLMYLPRICQWFSADFGSNEEMLRKVVPYLREEVRQLLASSGVVSGNSIDVSLVSIRYLPYSFDCRMLILA